MSSSRLRPGAVQNERVNRDRNMPSTSSSYAEQNPPMFSLPVLTLPPPPLQTEFAFPATAVLGRLGLSYWSQSSNQVREDEVTSSQEAHPSYHTGGFCCGLEVSSIGSSHSPAGLLLLDSAEKLLSLSLASVRAIPSFQQLPESVQRRLLEESWKDLFILTAAQWQFNFADVMSKKSNEDAEDEKSVKLKTNRLCKFVRRLRQLRPDHTEYACMKTIVLFKPEWCPDLEEHHSRQIEMVQEQTYQMLRECTSNVARSRSLVLVLLSLASVDQDAVSSLYFSHPPQTRLHSF